jgi:hypothetical protein
MVTVLTAVGALLRVALTASRVLAGLLLPRVCAAGVFTPGKADRCVTSAMDYILTVPQPDPLSYSPLLADVGDKQ